MSNKPKYFAMYHGLSYHSYTSYDTERVMAVPSLRVARDLFCSFYGGSAWYDEYQQNADGFYVPWSADRYSLTPATSREDYMDLYVAVENTLPGTYIMGQEIAYRLTWGERGGIVVEK